MIYQYHRQRLFSLILLITVLFSAFAPAASAEQKRQNPYFNNFNQAINFGEVTAADVKEATEQAIAEAKKAKDAIVAVKAKKRTFDNTMLAMDNFYDKLYSVAYVSSILSNAHPDSAVRNAGQRSLSAISKFGNDLSLDEGLYNAVKAYAATKDAQKLTGHKKKFLTETIRDYERSGFALSPEKRQELKAINNRISDLGLAFNQNIAEYKDQLLVSEADMKGLPEDYIKSRKKEGENYIITLDGPSYTTFMKYAESDKARKELMVKYQNRAADKNLDVLKQLLAERQKMANLLGYKTYAAYLTGGRMAKTPETVWAFENNLVARVKEKTEQDVNELLSVKRAHLNDNSIQTLNPWEISYYNNLLMKDKYALDQEQLKEYFALDNVIDGLFQTTQQLFGLKYEEVKNASVWQEDVRLFEVKRDGKLVGRFYLDLHPRDNKYTHAACFSIRKGKATPQGYQIPTAALICNFYAPTDGKPAFMSHGQVETFFHEFGHVLHNLLTTAELSSQSGTAVKRDFVEAPSQIFENWAWNYDALKLFAKHYKTGQVLPKALYQKMWDARNVGSGIAASAQIFYGTLDMTLHDKFDPNGSETTTDVIRKVQNQIMPYPY
ncbi:MAG: Zn-dependent oligopeptidase, partial [Hymenobacteraceae bacterium]|nr:Zn-dependent oligopeptidase [Hymenobacteraceae bacterium]